MENYAGIKWGKCRECGYVCSLNDGKLGPHKYGGTGFDACDGEDMLPVSGSVTELGYPLAGKAPGEPRVHHKFKYGYRAGPGPEGSADCGANEGDEFGYLCSACHGPLGDEKGEHTSFGRAFCCNRCAKGAAWLLLQLIPEFGRKALHEALGNHTRSESARRADYELAAEVTTEYTDFAAAAVALARDGRVTVLYNDLYDIRIRIDLDGDTATVTNQDGSYSRYPSRKPELADEPCEAAGARHTWYVAAELRRVIPCIPPDNLVEMGGPLGLARSMLMVRLALAYAADASRDED